MIATYWTTIPIARALQPDIVVHFCQGYEADYPHLERQKKQIETSYDFHCPTFVVAPFLGRFLEERYERRTVVVSPPVDPLFRANVRLGARPTPWIAVHGIFECTWKGVVTGLEAIKRLRNKGIKCRVLRFSLLPLSDEEKTIVNPDRYLCNVPPSTVAKEMRKCDLLLFPSLETEGFGLPLLEAMRSKIPAVASRIPSTEYFCDNKVELVPPGDPEAFASAAAKLLNERARWRKARSDGYKAAQRFFPNRIKESLSRAVEWASSELQKGT